MSTSVLWDFSVFSAWECSLSLVMFLTTCVDRHKKNSQSISYDTHHHYRHAVGCPSNLSEGLSLILFASVLGNLLQGSSPLGPLLHFDQARKQTDQQKENQEAQQGNDGHIQCLQLVGCMEAGWDGKEGHSSAFMQ